MRDFVNSENNSLKWIIFDGPVDPVSINSLK